MFGNRLQRNLGLRLRWGDEMYCLGGFFLKRSYALCGITGWFGFSEMGSSVVIGDG